LGDGLSHFGRTTRS
jgi:hypothetical protein